MVAGGAGGTDPTHGGLSNMTFTPGGMCDGVAVSANHFSTGGAACDSRPVFDTFGLAFGLIVGLTFGSNVSRESQVGGAARCSQGREAHCCAISRVRFRFAELYRIRSEFELTLVESGAEHLLLGQRAERNQPVRVGDGWRELLAVRNQLMRQCAVLTATFLDSWRH